MASTILYQPYWYDTGDELTVRASAPINLGHLVMVSGDRNGGNISGAHAPAGGYCLGVARADTAAGDVVAVFSGGIMRVVTGASITAGQSVEIGANGTVIPHASGIVIGYAVQTTVSVGDFAAIRFVI
ncbi:MAG: hypothetical protein JWR37_1035 [Mycobacterium sp.]|nr:hypothetical protein [Mycobacterium sp.]